MAKTFDGMTKIEILESFGYKIFGKDGKFVAHIEDDPEGFTLVCATQDEAIAEAYTFLQGEVAPDMGYVFPT